MSGKKSTRKPRPECSSGDNRDLDLLQFRVASLGRTVKLPQRFDFVVKQFDPHRTFPVRRVNVDDSAAAGKLARQFNGRRLVKFLLQQPGDERVNIDLVAIRRSDVSAPERNLVEESVAAVLER